jgi:hypothetical protein
MERLKEMLEVLRNNGFSLDVLKGLPEVIELVEFAEKGYEACKDIRVPIGSEEFSIYEYQNHTGEYEAWGTVNHYGLLTLWTSWGGHHELGRLYLMSFEEILLGLADEEMGDALKRFLKERIRLSEEEKK